MRDLTGFVETRQQLLTLKPNHRMNWIGFAVAQHLNAKYDLTCDLLNSVTSTMLNECSCYLLVL